MSDEAKRKRIDQLFTEALDLPVDARDVFLNEACAGDSELHDRVKELLAAAEQDDDFLPTGGALQGHFARAIGAEASPPPPDRAGPFRIIREIGRGGMSVVYLAHRESGGFDQHVAIKLIKPGVDSEEMLRRFAQERQILASLNHPAIARLLDGGWTAEGRPYFAMELVEGLPIVRHCEQNDLDIDQRLALFVSAARAVAYAHERQIVHRDLKPSNILVNQEGRVRLLDFGIAKLLSSRAGATLTRQAHAPLTPEYASPEQVRGQTVTSASDVYQLGVLLYELLTGRSPYQLRGEGKQSLAQAICDQTPTRPSISVTSSRQRTTKGTMQDEKRWQRQLRGDLDTIVMMALRKEAGRRYPSAAELVDDIERYLAGQPVAARKDTFGYRTQKVLRRHATTTVAAVLAVVGLIAIVGSQFSSTDRTLPSRANSVAVLPFTTSGDSEIENLSLSLVDGVLNMLQSIPQLRVVARESSFSLGSPDDDLDAIAEQLDVATLLLGSLHQDEQGLRISIQLMEADSGTELWSGSYAQQDGELLFVTREISTDILEPLAGRLGIRLAAARGASAGTNSAEAYTLYLEGQRQYLARGEGVRRSIELFKQAVAIDGEFAHAWAGLATAYSSSLSWGGAPENVEELIAETASRAIALDETLGSAYMALGGIQVRRQNLVGGAEHLYKALAVSPNDPTVLVWSAEAMLDLGRSRDSLQFAQLLYELSPVAPNGTSFVGLANLALGNLELAKEFCDRAWREHQMASRCSYLASVEADDFDAASEWIDLTRSRGAEVAADVVQMYLGARRDSSNENIERVVAAIERAVEARSIGANMAFYYYATLGDLDRAFEVLDEMFAAGRFVDTSLWWLPSLGPIRRDARFGAVAERAGLADFWHAHGWPDNCHANDDRIQCE